MELASCHPWGSLNLEVALRFLENVCIHGSRYVSVFQRDLLPLFTGYLKVSTLMITADTCEIFVHTYQATLCYPSRWLSFVQHLQVYSN